MFGLVDTSDWLKHIQSLQSFEILAWAEREIPYNF